MSTRLDKIIKEKTKEIIKKTNKQINDNNFTNKKIRLENAGLKKQNFDQYERIIKLKEMDKKKNIEISRIQKELNTLREYYLKNEAKET